MNRGALSVVTGTVDPVIASAASARRARDEADMACREAIAAAREMSRRLDAVASLDAAAPGVADLLSRLAAQTMTSATAAGVILDRVRGTAP